MAEAGAGPEWPFDVVSGDEYARLSALYEPLTQAIRDLVDAGVRTGVDGETIAAAQAAIEEVTRTLNGRRHDRTHTLRHADTGRPLAWANPAVGLRNAIAPPMRIDRTDDDRWVSDFTLGAAYEGPPNLVHGGICALVLDHLLGEAASDGLTKPLFTGTITLRYLRGTPLGPLHAEAWIDRTDGIKTFARGVLRDAEGVTVEADGIFIMPAWARDAG
ncbi:PaaI family thioesterase [Mycolicibacterium litorale]|uniref:Acyl-coenzyme A thioesterase THEM4 n=1 Tax=Mycolicibacterium litorale TaxID=758802 RepID=A0AAD1MSM6_9MYCO|nr:PaaI family thioesterase [Mycolicibacterium litorale]TDY01443.1 acyl-coenzyme A thioesterase PaaI-like protein [Mycolicibacterium litorale]BBY15343.1 thioesterase [Mycolicibacterium litorale]